MGAAWEQGEVVIRVRDTGIGIPPEMLPHGLEMYVQSRRRPRPRSAGATLVALTGWGQAGDRDRSRQAGFDRHVVKPLDPEVARSLLSERGPGGLA